MSEKAAKKKGKKGQEDPQTPPPPTSLIPVSPLSSPLIVPKKAEAIPPLESRLEVLTASISKQYQGKAVIRQGRDISNVFILRRPTGIISVDLALGGGFPAGGLSQIIGKDSSGKSYLVMRTIAECQKIYGTDCAIGVCMTEMPWDKAFAKWHCGVRVAFNDLEIARLAKLNEQYGRPIFTPEHITWLKDQVGYVQEVRAATAEHLLEIAVQMVESNLYQIVMIDSFGALLTMAEAEAEEGIADKHRGGASMAITQFLHRLHAALNMLDKNNRQNTTTVLGINQYRDNVNAGLYGNPMKQAGGWALRHGKLVDLHVEQGKRHRIEKQGADYGRIVGKEINWEIIKGKAGCHDGPKGTYNFYFGTNGYPFGVDVIGDLMATAIERNVVEQNGAWYYFRGQSLGQGQQQATWNLAQNPAWLEEIKKDIYSAAGLTYITKEDF